jgi:4-hydroxy-2-oxoglutarate aldolase
MTFTGVYAPIPTPFTDDGELDLGGWSHNLDRWMATGLHGVVVLGSNGEAPFIDDDESARLIAAARARVPSDRRLIAGTGRQSTRGTIEASRRAAAAGADAVLVRTPSFFKSQLTAGAFVRHFSAVADACPVPVLLYNFSALTGVTLPTAAAATLALHDNIVGVKESGPDMSYVGDLVGLASDRFSVLVGSAPTFFTSLLLGAHGGILALASVAPDACLRLYALVREGRLDEARDLQRQIVPLAKLVGSVYGIPGLKAALAMRGYVGGRPRLPLEPVGDDAIAQIEAQLDLVSGLAVGAAS